MCSTSTAWVFDGHIPLLRYMHLVSHLVPPFHISHKKIRSQTSWIWLETKLIELGMLGGSQSYQVMTPTSSIRLPKGFIVFQISFGKLWQGVSIGHFENQYSQFWTRLLCSLYFPRGMASHIVTMLSLCKSSGTISLNCEPFLSKNTFCFYQVNQN